MSSAVELAALFRRDLTRLSQEIAAFPPGELLWTTLPGVNNSAGNLALHLEGNLREYIGRQICSVAYVRQRPAEFSRKDISQAELLQQLADLTELIPGLLERLQDSQMESLYPENVLGQPISVRQFLLHLYGHFNYHLGQIDYLRRILTGNAALPLAGL